MGGLKDHWKILRKQGLECDLSLKEIFKIWLLFETKLQGMCGEKAMVIVWGRGGGQRLERELPCEWISPSLPGMSPQPSATAQPSSLPLAVSVWGAITPASSLASCFSPLEAPTSQMLRLCGHWPSALPLPGPQLPDQPHRPLSCSPGHRALGTPGFCNMLSSSQITFPSSTAQELPNHNPEEELAICQEQTMPGARPSTTVATCISPSTATAPLCK